MQVCAQPIQVVSKHYTMKDGLPDGGVTSVIQDRNGFIWLGTYSGLCRFDGYSFINYRNDPNSSISLRNNHITDICEDEFGRLWISHAQGLDLFDPQTEKFLMRWPTRADEHEE